MSNVIILFLDYSPETIIIFDILLVMEFSTPKADSPLDEIIEEEEEEEQSEEQSEELSGPSLIDPIIPPRPVTPFNEVRRQRRMEALNAPIPDTPNDELINDNFEIDPDNCFWNNPRVRRRYEREQERMRRFSERNRYLRALESPTISPSYEAQVRRQLYQLDHPYISTIIDALRDIIRRHKGN